MSLCRVCNASITWALTMREDQRVPLDDHVMRDYGPDRYRIVIDGLPPRVEPIRDESPASTFVDHRAVCQAARAT